MYQITKKQTKELIEGKANPTDFPEGEVTTLRENLQNLEREISNR